MLVFFFFNDTATTEIYTLSLHDALPIFLVWRRLPERAARPLHQVGLDEDVDVAVEHAVDVARSEEHTSELQSQSNLVCRLLLEKKNQTDDANDDVLHATRHCDGDTCQIS